MKKSIFKTVSFWIILTAFISSLFVIFVTPYLFESYKDLNFRLLIAFSIFFGTIILVLLSFLLKKEETQEVIKEKKEQFELKKEYEKIINLKVKDLKTKFNEAIKIIKKSSLYKSRRKAKYELPWYLVFGNCNEGKTTLLESSGLSFPLNVDYDNRQVIEEQSTNTFQWYFAEHSVFIDIPGNYVEQKQNPEDTIVWKEFLKIFVKKRWRRPINGIILPISIDTIFNKNEKELEIFARDLRDRFDELSVAFMSSVPIYLIITKSDKIEGFNEYFASLKEEEKNEILGITFDSENKSIDTNVIKPHLEDLLKRLNSSILEKIHFEWEQQNRGKIFSFCENFSNLFEKVNLFIDMCFSQTRYRKPLLLRGIYFTSVPGENNPHALISQDKLNSSRHNTKGLFIKKLLTDIIFPESDIIKMDEKYENKIKRNQYITYGISLFFVAFFSFFIVKNFINHNNLLSKLEKNYEVYLSDKNKVLPSDDFENIVKILNKLEDIKNYNEINTSSNFGNLLFFKVDDRKEKLLKQYHTDLVKLLVSRVAKDIERNIVNELSDFDKTWDNTKAYIMLQNLKRRDSDFLIEYMSIYWNKRYQNMPKIQADLNNHWNNLLKLGFNSYDIDDETLKLARNRLVKFGSEQLAYKGIKNSVEKMNLKDFTFAQALENNVSSFNNNDYVIPGFYTKKGYFIMIKEGRTLTSQILLNNWVIGERTDLNEVEINEYYKKILSFYFADYKNYWNNALSKLNISSYERIIDLNNQLSLLSSADSPIIAILKELKDNTELYTPAEQLQMSSDDDVTNAVTGQIASAVVKKALDNSGKALDNTNVKNLREFFKPYNDLLDKNFQATSLLKEANSKINYAYQTMTSIQGAITPEDDSFKIVSERVNGKTESIIAPLNSLPLYVKKWYSLVLQSNWKYLLSNTKSYLNTKYSEEVYSFYSQRLEGKYPIKRNESNNYVKLDDFSDFFKNGGILDNFYKNYLSTFLSINGGNLTYSYKNLDGSLINIDKNLIQSLLASYKIRETFFRNNGSLGFDASIKPYDLSSNLATVYLMYDDNSIYYEHGPIINKKIMWPPQSLNNVVKFKLFDLSNTLVSEKYIDNDWALFKLMDEFSVNSKSNNEVVYKYFENDYNASFLIKGTIVNMLNNGSLSNFYLSKNL